MKKKPISTPVRKEAAELRRDVMAKELSGVAGGAPTLPLPPP
jgi:hypothetical protein